MKIEKSNILYVSLIIIIWLCAYIFFQVAFEQKLGWDEINYMSQARGIAQDFDFSARSYTIIGLLKYGYPTNLINYPIYPLFLAIFFKVFGVSMYVAYFSNWLCALGVCILTYFIFLTLSDNSHKLAFAVSMFYLFAPGILKNCDSGMMEQCGCFLLCLFLLLILKDYKRSIFNVWTLVKITISLLILFLYKSLYIGYFFGIFVLIFLTYKTNIISKVINTKIPFFVSFISSFGSFVIFTYVLSKWIFLPVAPMMNFSPEQDLTQEYADFLGGYFNNFSVNLTKNLIYFLKNIIAPYFIYPTSYIPYTGEILQTTSWFVFLGIYFIVFLLILLLTFSGWKNMTPVQRLFVCFSITTIISFNLIFDVLFRSYHTNILRYNSYYLPIYFCLVAIVLKANLEYVKSFVTGYPLLTKLIGFIFILFIYMPMSLSALVQYLYNEDYYHVPARERAEFIEKVIGNTKPKFIYFNDGTHTAYVTYPVVQIFKDATNEQLIQANKVLPEPIEYLFLRPSDWLVRNNKDLILKGEPIVNGMYKLLGYNEKEHIVVYKLNK